jgi:hypothetical protein
MVLQLNAKATRRQAHPIYFSLTERVCCLRRLVSPAGGAEAVGMSLFHLSIEDAECICKNRALTLPSNTEPLRVLMSSV